MLHEVTHLPWEENKFNERVDTLIIKKKKKKIDFDRLISYINITHLINYILIDFDHVKS